MLRNKFAFLTKSLLFTLIFLSAMFFAVVSYIFIQIEQYTLKVYPNVYINNLSFAGQTKKQVRAYFSARNRSLKNSEIEIRYLQEIATFSASTINLEYDADTAAQQAFSIGRSSHTQSRIYQVFTTLLRLDRFDFIYYPQFDPQPIAEYLTYLKDTYEKPPQDALFEVNNGKVTAFKIEKDGISLNTEKSLERLKEKIHKLKPSNKAQTIQIALVASHDKPQTRLSDINNLGIVEKIGEGRSNFRGSAPERVHNIALAASRFHGVLIKPQETFSFNAIVGDISASTGYKAAYVIKAGRTVLGDGGGVCQDSTTLFRAALNAGLPIIERHAHAYRVHYYEQGNKPGFDATVFAPSADLKFLNDTPSHILIQSFVDKNNSELRFEFYGKRDKRIVSLSDAIVWDIRPAPEPQYIEDPTLSRGITKQVDFAATGAKASFHYRVEKDGKIIQDKDFYSNFRPWQAVYMVGIMD